MSQAVRELQKEKQNQKARYMRKLRGKRGAKLSKKKNLILKKLS
jgi:hypothetical protein